MKWAGLLAAIGSSAVIAIAAMLVTPTTASAIEDYCIQKSAFASLPELEVGSCVRFSNEIYTTFCREIRAGDRIVGWF